VIWIWVILQIGLHCRASTVVPHLDSARPALPPKCKHYY
jgi:hypothetical protein